MDILHNMQLGFQVIMTLTNLLYCFLGCFMGTMIGVLPGIGPLAALSLLLPMTFNTPPLGSIIMLSGIFYGAMYGGSITSILVNIPGEAASVVTCLDGYQMARQGRAGPALGIAAMGSFIAGTIGTLFLNFLSPFLGVVALKFGPPEYFSVMVLGFVICLFMIGGAISKAVLMIAFGLFVSTIGMDVVNGAERFTFDFVNLSKGFDLVAVIMGIFGLSEILFSVEEIYSRHIFEKKITGLLPSIKEWRDSIFSILRGSLLGFALGMLPGSGPVTASFISYGIERKVSRHPEKFGSGIIEGVAGPEAANNSAVAGSMIPLLSLGIPGNAVTALLLGAFIIHGIQPGPLLMTQHPDLFWGVIASMYVGNFMLLVLNLPLIGLWVQFLRIPYWILFPIIFLLCAIGSYSSNTNIFDVWTMIGFGVVGYFLRKMKYELSPFILALVLGPMLEQSLRQSLIISNQNPLIFITRPISASLLGITLLFLLIFARGMRKKKVRVAERISLK